MKDIFKIDEKFDSYQDENLKYIKEVSERIFDLHSGLIFVESLELESDYKNAVKKLRDPKNQSWGILEKEVAGMNQELARLIRVFEGFYLTNVDEYKPNSSNLSPQKINYLINTLMIRIKRMICVLDPEYSVIKFKDKKTDNDYTMIKGYWINDEGKKVRSLSRNVGNTESSINELTMKLLKINKNNVIITEPEYSLRFRPDLRVNDGKTEWFVETKSMNIENLIRSFVMFENWKLYKEEYELLS